MNDKACSIEGCGSSYRMRRGWCNKHYIRWRIYGDPLAGAPDHYRDPEEAFLRRTQRTQSGCLQWTAAIDSNGYGRIRIKDRLEGVHRYAWERANGPIPEGKFVDHMCHNRACCEVAHLRLATNKQNLENMKGPRADNTSGIRGVTFHKATGKWRPRVRHNGVAYYDGLYESIEEAEAAVIALRARLFTHSQN